MGEPDESLVLIVEADAARCAALAEILAQAGHQVREATAAEQALSLARERTPDLVLLGRHLPEAERLTLVRQLKADPITTAVPVLYVSGPDGVQPAARGLDQGAECYLLEPSDPGLLLATVRALLRVRQMERASAEALRQAEARTQEVQERRRLLDAVFTTVPNPIVIFDAEGRVQQVNAAVRELYGFDPTGMLHQDLLARLAIQTLDGQPATPEAVPSTQALRGEAVHDAQLVLTDARGERVVVLASAAPLCHNGGPCGAVAIWQGITRQAQAQQELERVLAQAQTRRALLSAVVRQLPAGVVIAEAPNGRILLANEQMERIWRRAVALPETIEAYHHWKGFHPDGRPYRRDEWPVERSFRNGEVVLDEEIEVERADGTRATLLVSSSPIRDERGLIVAGVVVDVDITDRKQSQRELERLLEIERARVREARLLDTITESVPQAMAYLDHELRFQRVNQAYAQLAGLPPEELLGHTFPELASDGGEVAARLRRVLDTGERAEVRELPYRLSRHPELGLRYLDASATPVTNGSGPRVEGLVLSIADVTDRVEQRERLLAAERARAELAENLGAEVAHRVKNNLAMLAGLLQMQISEQEDPKVASALHDAASRLVAFSRIHEQLQTPQPEGIDLLDSVRRIAEATREVFADRRVSLEVDGEPIFCRSSVATNLSVVANELITNAIKHGRSPNGGALVIRLHLDHHDGRLHLRIWNSGNPVSADLDLNATPSLGLRLVHALVVGQYHGAFTLRPESGGSLAEVTLDASVCQ